HYEGISLRHNGDYRVSDRNGGHDERKQTQQRILRGRYDPYSPKWFVHSDGDVPHGGMVHDPFELVGPSGIQENTFDSGLEFCRSLFLSDCMREVLRNLLFPLGKVLR